MLRSTRMLTRNCTAQVAGRSRLLRAPAAFKCSGRPAQRLIAPFAASGGKRWMTVGSEPSADAAASADEPALTDVEVVNRRSVLSEIDAALGRSKPPAIEYLYTEPVVTWKLWKLSSSVNPFGHAAGSPAFQFHCAYWTPRVLLIALRSALHAGWQADRDEHCRQARCSHGERLYLLLCNSSLQLFAYR